MRVDLNPLYDVQHEESKPSQRIREKSNAGVRFSTSRDGQYISNVAMWIGQGRDRTERKINLSIPQGKFLFHLPFPSAEPMSVDEIMEKAGVDNTHRSEILDIVKELIEYGVIESE